MPFQSYTNRINFYFLFNRFKVQDPSGEYEYHIGICTSGLAEDGTEAGVVQIDLKKSNNKVPLGKYTRADIMAGSKY